MTLAPGEIGSARLDKANPRGQTLKEAAEAFGLSYAAVKQIKSRIDRAVAALEKMV